MKKIAILFPGQGAQYLGMGKDLVNEFKIAAETYEEANEALGYDLRKTIFLGDMADLTHSENAQPAVVTASYALFRVYMQEIGISPDLTAGHSLGEITALIASGGISFKDAIRFAKIRSNLMHQAYIEKKGRVAIIFNLNEEILKKEVDKIRTTQGYVAVTGYNSPFQMLVAGEESAMLALGKTIADLNGEYVPFSMLPMKVDAPYHSAIMGFLTKKLEKELEALTFCPLQWDVISNITALPYKSHMEIQKKLSLQLVNPVKWRQTISYIETKGADIYIDIGPNYILKTLVSECNDTLNVFCFDLKSDIDRLTKTLSRKEYDYA